MMQLDRPHSTQQLSGTELDEVLIGRRERVPACQQGVKGFVGADEIRDFFPNRMHGDSPYPLTG